MWLSKALSTRNPIRISPICEPTACQTSFPSPTTSASRRTNQKNRIRQGLAGAVSQTLADFGAAGPFSGISVPALYFFMALRSWSPVCAALFLLFAHAEPSRAQTTDWGQEELAWRTQHAADLQKPDGWLSLIGLEWLEPGVTSLGSAADNKIHLPAPAAPYLAVLKLENGAVEFLAPKSGFPAGLKVDGVPAKEQTLRADPDHDKYNPRITY